VCAAKPALARKRQRVRSLARKRFSMGPPTPYTSREKTPKGVTFSSRIGLPPPMRHPT